MDWVVIGGIVVAGWAMLSVLSSERMGQAQRLAIELANLAAEQARARENQIPIAAASEPPFPTSATAQNRKR